MVFDSGRTSLMQHKQLMECSHFIRPPQPSWGERERRPGPWKEKRCRRNTHLDQSLLNSNNMAVFFNAHWPSFTINPVCCVWTRVEDVSACACGVCAVCLSSCRVGEEVAALGFAIRAVGPRAAVAIWTHGEEPGPDVSGCSSPLGVIRSPSLSAVWLHISQQWCPVF